MADNGPKPDEPLCPYWQKQCSEVNSGKVVCKKLLTIMVMQPNGIAPRPMLVCQDDVTMSTTQRILQAEMRCSAPQSQQRGLNINDILRKGER
jgi:uncharacterized protein (DUF2236 family)